MIKIKPLIICIIIPLLVGGLSALITSGSMQDYGALTKPTLSPPSAVFPIVWTVLYILMGISSYLVYMSTDERKTKALKTYGLQLVFNFLWPIAFFCFKWYLFAFVWLVALWVLVLIMIIQFSRINKRAGYMQIPYLVWLTFAAYLNLFIYILN